MSRADAGLPDDWRDLALCAEVDPDLFFPETGGPVKAAKRVCSRCEVQDECLAEGLRQDRLDPGNVTPGIWGGVPGHARRGMR